ncbi:unnamed protein product [Didymodactylos carnosus]|uniref:U2A'/phosphoprotein 32 family A C-terminal domain-containing protein n=1 Tax=Didymodactylos carnosus TaxID=1234261 RepID=A0A813NZG6_9BILA|nr:unnamed protein product [Didymodactylos carnosus]CAF3525667.1 unnamed protein product [Didymodactylos carnosus]
MHSYLGRWPTVVTRFLNFNAVRLVANISLNTASKKFDSIENEKIRREEDYEYEYKDQLDILRRHERLTVDSTNPQYMTAVFNGEFNRDILTYPELLTKTESIEMNKLSECLKTFTNKIDRKKIERENHIDKDIVKEMKKLKLFSLVIPEEFDGLNLNSQLSIRIFEELAVNPTITTMLLVHTEYAVRSILLYGTNNQQRYYLPDLASGELVGTACITEAHCGSDIRAIETTAKPKKHDEKIYVLNGKKMWITNGENAGLFLVYCKTNDKITHKDYDDRFSFFLVHRDMDGVKISPTISTLGLRGLGLTHIEFENVEIDSTQHLIGQLGEGLNILRNLHGYVRTTLSGMCVGVVKKLTELTVERCIKRESFDRKLIDNGLIQKKLFQIELDTYGMESMTYLTSGILDSFSMPIISIESAITKIFSTDKLYRIATDCLEIYGVEGIEIGHPIEQYLRDIRPWSMFDAPNDVLRLLTAWEGVTNVSSKLSDYVKKIRNPFDFPALTIANVLYELKEKAEIWRVPFTFKHDLWKCVHPSLGVPSKDLEYAIFVLRNTTKQAVVKSGRDIIDNQFYLRRLAEIAIEIYGMTAMLGRASRSYSVGLKNCDHEKALTFSYCTHAREHVTQLENEINQKEHSLGDEHMQHIAKRMLKAKGYTVTTPSIIVFYLFFVSRFLHKMGRLTPEIIEGSPQYLNPVGQYELSLRDLKIPVIENLGCTLNQFDTIDFTNNDLRKLVSLIYLYSSAKNRIVEGLHQYIPNLDTIILSNNNIQELSDIDPLASLTKLTHISLTRNPIAMKKDYRLYVIHTLPNIRTLDFNRIRLKEKEAARKMFKTKSKEAAKNKNKSKTFVPGEGLDGKPQQQTSQTPKISKKDTEAIKKAILEAKSFEEVEKLKAILQSGQIPSELTGEKQNGHGDETMEQDEEENQQQQQDDEKQQSVGNAMEV